MDGPGSFDMSPPAPGRGALAIGLDALGQFMPMALWCDDGGVIGWVGPTLAKVAAPRDLLGARLFDAMSLRAADRTDMKDLRATGGTRLRAGLRGRSGPMLKGIAVALGPGEGVLFNFSFGIAAIDAVRDHRLNSADFSPTDLTVEMLYLNEAKTAVVQELKALTGRLNGARRAAEEQALTDTLTGLRNRRGMDAALRRLIVDDTPFGLMHLDLDHFKAVNDGHGHAAGDAVLSAIARILAQEIRAGDTVARIGGDEFVLIFPRVQDYGPLAAIGRRILDRVGQPVLHHGMECRVSASIGATLSSLYVPPDPVRMLADADAALYDSKRAGRGRLTLVAGPGRDRSRGTG